MYHEFIQFETQIQKLSNADLLSKLNQLFSKEKKLADAILIGLKEIKARRLFAEMGYASLFEMLVKYFKLSEGSSYQRLSALKLIEAVPAAQDLLLQGEVSLGTLAETQSFISKIEKAKGEKIPTKEKEKLIENIKNKSQKEVKQLLIEQNPTAALPSDKEKVLNAELTQLQIKVDQETLLLINELKSLLSHQIPDGCYNELLKHMAKKTLEQLKKESHQKPLKDERTATPVIESQCNKAKSSQTRYIPERIKKIVFARANYQCQFISADGKRCESKYQLEVNHIKPFSQGGSNDLSNFDIQCRIHNSFRTKETHGYWFKN